MYEKLHEENVYPHVYSPPQILVHTLPRSACPVHLRSAPSFPAHMPYRGVTCTAVCVRQVLILEPTKQYMPSYVVVNLDAETSSMHISNLCLDSLRGKCRQVHEWVLEATNIKGIRYGRRGKEVGGGRLAGLL